MEGRAEDLEEDEEARLRETRGTVSIFGVSQVPDGLMGGTLAAAELALRLGPAPALCPPLPQQGPLSPEVAKVSVRPDPMSGTQSLHSHPWQHPQQSLGHEHIPEGHLHCPPQHPSMMVGENEDA